MKFVFITLFPEMIRSACEWSILGRAAREGLLSVECVDPRDYATDRHRSVDDTTCGGGAGMVLKPQTFLAALDRARELAPGALVAAMTPVGESLGQERVCDLAGSGRDLILLCGHYEGFDERILEEADLRLSIGDFVLTGGELPALCVMDAVARFIPGVLGKQVSAEEDSFHHSLLEYPQWRTEGNPCRSSCSPATTQKSANGGGRKACGPPAATVRSCCGPCSGRRGTGNCSWP